MRPLLRSTLSARLVLFAAMLLPGLASTVHAQSAAQDTGKQDYSDAERIIFMTEHLGTLQPP